MYVALQSFFSFNSLELQCILQAILGSSMVFDLGVFCENIKWRIFHKGHLTLFENIVMANECAKIITVHCSEKHGVFSCDVLYGATVNGMSLPALEESLGLLMMSSM